MYSSPTTAAKWLLPYGCFLLIQTHSCKVAHAAHFETPREKKQHLNVINTWNNRAGLFFLRVGAFPGERWPASGQVKLK